MRQWRPSLTGLLAGAAIAAFGRAAVVAVHLDAISTAAMPVLAWAAMIGVMIGGLAGLSGSPRIGAVLGAVLSAAVYVIMMPLALFVTVILLEIRPMITFIRWRRALGRGEVPDTSGARALYLVNHIEMALVVIIVFVASFMARGFGMR